MIRIVFSNLVLLLVLTLVSCVEPDEETPDVNGMQPIYIPYGELYRFSQQPPQPIVNAGKIMVYNQYLFLGEVNRGVHIIDISDTLNPYKVSFLSIPGCKDVAAQNNRLYTDNGPDLLILNIENINNVTLVQRKKDYFQPSEYFPSDYSGPFECVDYSLGWVGGWRQTMLNEPKCFR